MKLVIAEKPSLAAAIREAVGGDYTITNAFGHIYEQAEPDDYLPDDVPKNSKGNKIWRAEDLPIIPTTWIKRPVPKAKEQVAKIRDLLKSATLVVNAGDPDREGQLLIDEILEELKFKGSVKRVWLKSLTTEAIRDAFSKLQPNENYKPLSDAATARSRADWLLGMNLTRAWTLKNGAMLSIGRVQTPTLALIVRRDESIDNFKSHNFFELFARIKHQNGTFVAKWKPNDTDTTAFDSDGRLTFRTIAEQTALKAKGNGKVTHYKSEQKKKSAPLPYSLSALQKAASAKHGFGAQKVLDLAQQLYEEKLTTYPRTDCQYLGEDQLDEVMGIAKHNAAKYAVELSKSTHAAFNKNKVTAHTAIVPTNKDANYLTGDAAKLYDMIARSVVALFMPDKMELSIEATILLGDENWVAAGSKVTNAGWAALFSKDQPEDDNGEGNEAENPILPAMSVHDAVTAVGAEIKTKKTTPPVHFTEGTLIEAMSNIHRYIDDVSAKAKLKETSGIGTEATRANIIETLFKREFLEKKGKSVISTQAGRSLVKVLPDDLTNPVTTALWETALSDIAEGKSDLNNFEQKIREHVKIQINLAVVAGIPNNRASQQPNKTNTSFKTATCPVCGKTARQLESKSKTGVFYWACENKEHGLMADEKGKPGKQFSAR